MDQNENMAPTEPATGSNDIRARRLARLAALASANANANAQQEQQQQQQQQTQAHTKDNKTQIKTKTQLQNQSHTIPSQIPQKKLEKQPFRSIESPNEESLAHKKILTPEKKQQQFEQTPIVDDISKWTHTNLQYILNATLDEKFAQQKKGYFYLDGLKEESEGNIFNVDLIDSALIEILTEKGVTNTIPNIKVFDYLYDSWSRALSTKRLVKINDPIKDEKISVVDKAIVLISSYASLIFQVADMFVDEIDIDKIIEEIYMKINTGNYDSFLVDIITRTIENEADLELMNLILPKLSKKLYSLDLSIQSNYNNILTIFEIFLSNKFIASKFHQIDNFHPENLKAYEFEKKSLLGPLLRISPLLPSIFTHNYDQEILSKQQIQIIHESLQTEHGVIIYKLFSICDKLIRSGETSRNEFLKYLSDIVNKNHLRRGEHAQVNKIATDAFMVNITIILMKFSQPFLSINSTRLNKIDSNYLNYENKLIDLSEETKLNSTIQEYNEYFSNDNVINIDKPLNFISECFYLLLTYIHYGLGGLYITSDRVTNYIKQLKQQIKQFEDTINSRNLNNGGNGNNNPFMDMLIKTKLDPLKQKLKQFKANKLAIEMFSINRNLQLEIFDCVIGSIQFFLKLLDPNHEYPNKSINIPFINLDNQVEKLDDVEFLRENAPIPFKFFPEMFIEGLINYCHFIGKFNNNPMLSNDEKLNIFVEFSIIILRCPELISNPHLKSRLTEVLFYGSLPTQDKRNGYMIEIFINNKLIKENLIISLLDFYVMVEKTGASSQFYDKFNSRYHISVILEQIWQFEIFKNDLKKISIENLPFFIRVIARMLNDTTFLLDESLTQLHTIGSIQRELENRSKNLPDSMEETDEELNTKLSGAERQASSYVQLSNKTIHLFNLFTNEAPKSFVIVEIVDRLAGMLNYNLVALVGPKYNELKVKNPKNYSFDPPELLYQLCSIFINLSGEIEFVNAVARDTRSFNFDCFKRAINVLYKCGKIDLSFDEKLTKFSENAKEVKIQDEEEEMELGDDIPDEFLDPLMFTIMKDPVKLPHSKVSMDRSVLKAHLMNDPTDPFNRTPLKLEDVEDDEELKLKIENFKKEKKLSKINNNDSKMTDV
ncbi:hypothetical protein B5S28_g4275 [[Candida] boidinii]|nr:hypothetical protein B5S28_g4275 [[Candida] boidinii]